MRETSWPSSRYCPDVGRSRQPMMCMNVDLPDPDGPVTERNSPRSTSRSTPRNAFTSISPTMYVLTRLLTEITVGMGLAASPRAAALTRHERVARARGRGRRRPHRAQQDARHKVHSLLQFAAQPLRVRAVGDAEPQVHRLELFIHVQPRAASRLDRRQRREERVDRLSRLHRAVFGGGQRAPGCGAGLLAGGRLGHQRFEGARVAAVRFHAVDELLLLVGRHGLEALEASGRIAAALASLATTTAEAL